MASRNNDAAHHVALFLARRAGDCAGLRLDAPLPVVGFERELCRTPGRISQDAEYVGLGPLFGRLVPRQGSSECDQAREKRSKKESTKHGWTRAYPSASGCIAARKSWRAVPWLAVYLDWRRAAARMLA